ncbi:hypothetical protein AcW1_003333 [Taiwanofungus camphoratus]|nr:hypothetical protein AcW1_003333 [Antrodia cinnamomea]KAI0944063.1 hypothetical protein AcV7_001983 [Antrodia cinnamomea]
MQKLLRFSKFPRWPSWSRTSSSSLHSQGVDSLESLKPLYDCRPPWWTRWTYILVGADLVVTAASCELVWNHWTHWEETPIDNSSAQPSELTNGKAPERSASQSTGQYVLRPWWQRGPFAFGQLFLGLALAGVLLGSRSRIVRRLYILPPASGSTSVPAPTKTAQSASSIAKPGRGKSDERRLVIQCVHHFRTQGKVLPMRDCILDKGQNETELTLRANDIKGHFWFGLNNATINGQKLPLWKVRDEIFTSWYGEERGKRVRAEEKWKNGPAATKN